MLTVVRTTGAVYEAIKQDIDRYAPKETMLFSRARQVRLGDREIYLMPEVIALDENEACRSSGLTQPSPAFQQWFYGSLKKEGLLGEGYRVVTIHSHPFQTGEASFSAVDRETMARDREVYGKAYDGHDFVWLVFDRDARSFEGAVVRRKSETRIDALVVLGDQLARLTGTGGARSEKDYPRELYSRMVLIPAWDQERIAWPKVAVVGLGGIGSVVLQAVTELGIGDFGDLVLVDHDVVEASNLSRIPYASYHDIGSSKTALARRYVQGARPYRKVTTIEKPCDTAEAQQELASADLILGCVDSEVARSCLNHLAASFLVPLLDLGAGVIIDRFAGERVVLSSGQARLFIPGGTPCLLCNMGIRTEGFDRELARLKMDVREKDLLERAGYLQDFLAEDAPQPSVYNLNALVGAAGVTLLLRYLLGGGVDCHALHFNMEAMAFEKILTRSRDHCPVCGCEGLLGLGDFFDLESLVAEKQYPPPRCQKCSTSP
jgi:molybdopterin/thiamine biosynthesis adenylyltransferase